MPVHLLQPVIHFPEKTEFPNAIACQKTLDVFFTKAVESTSCSSCHEVQSCAKGTRTEHSRQNEMENFIVYAEPCA